MKFKDGTVANSSLKYKDRYYVPGCLKGPKLASKGSKHSRLRSKFDDLNVEVSTHVST